MAHQRPPRTPEPMAWNRTVGALVAQGARVRIYCNRCDFTTMANLDAIARAKGADFSLWDWWPRCPRSHQGCTGRAFFHASPAAGTPSRPLVSDWARGRR